MHPIIVQTLSYATVLLMAIGIMAFLMRGFFWPYLRVRRSLGRLVLVKVRMVHTDTYAAAKVIDGKELVFKLKGKDEKRLIIPDNSIFRRSIGVTWAEVDAETWAFVSPNMAGINSYDPNYWENLYIMALTRPTLLDKRMLYILIFSILAFLVGCFGIYLSYKTNKDIMAIKASMEALKGSIKGGLITATNI